MNLMSYRSKYLFIIATGKNHLKIAVRYSHLLRHEIIAFYFND